MIKRSEDLTPHDLEELLKLNVRGIVANLQEGCEAAVSLGQRMEVPVSVFSNFPDVEGYDEGYDNLLRENLRRLEETWKTP